MNHHHQYMREAFKWAAKGVGKVSPNPQVGAIIVKNNQIIGQGYHQKYGGPHAEVNAINNATTSVDGATLYCNLEPCCHTNKQTPPCVDFLIEKKIGRVVISNLDPNPDVNGKGVAKLEKAGIEVVTGVLEKEGRQLNEVFFKFITTKLPFVHLKFAQTLDGKIATLTGDAKWISNKQARELVHQWRFTYDGILIGRKTLTNDNPSLTARLESESSPLRIIVGNPREADCDAKVFTDQFRDKTIVCSTVEKSQKYNTCLVKGINERVDLKEMLLELGKRKIASILVEGGADIIEQFIVNKLYDKITVFIAPKIVGGTKGYSSNINIKKMDDAIIFDQTQIKMIGDQIMVEGYVHRNC